MTNAKILIKFPTRDRFAKFLKTFTGWQENIEDQDNTRFIISYDLDDETFDEAVAEQHATLVDADFIGGVSNNKIHACNRDLEGEEFDILILASDDMIVQVPGFDNIIRERMAECYPDGDGVLWFNDGFTDVRLNTLCIMGKKYYDRFGYIYHPDYQSLWCDNEFMDVANQLGKQTYSDMVIVRHEHPVNMGQEQDALYRHNEGFYHADEQVYLRRKEINFDL